MTERGSRRVQRGARCLQIGPSAMHWGSDGSLTIIIDELSAPWPRRLRGRVRVFPLHLFSQDFALDAAGRHVWRPLAPIARVEVDMSHPGLTWRGNGYVDMNHGREPLENRFKRWDWSRASLADRRCAVFYDIEGRHQGDDRAIALVFSPDGSTVTPERPPLTELPASGWRLARSIRAEAGEPVRLIQALEDGPFYSRSQLSLRLDNQPANVVHESLSLERFDRRWVQCLLPFRMPRLSR